MSSVNNTRTEILVDVELVSVEATSTALGENDSTEEQPLHHNSRNHSSNGAVVKSYQSTAPTTKTRTTSSTSDDSVLLPDVGYSIIQSN